MRPSRHSTPPAMPQRSEALHMSIWGHLQLLVAMENREMARWPRAMHGLRHARQNASLAGTPVLTAAPAATVAPLLNLPSCSFVAEASPGRCTTAQVRPSMSRQRHRRCNVPGGPQCHLRRVMSSIGDYSATSCSFCTSISPSRVRPCDRSGSVPLRAIRADPRGRRAPLCSRTTAN